jgi:patatin-related protein
VGRSRRLSERTSSDRERAAAALVDPPPFKPEQEVRYALVLFGGVSLAVYINGVVQEFFRLVCSTAPEWPLATNVERQVAWFPLTLGSRGDVRALSGTERVYRKLGQILPGGVDAPADAPVRTRFVVDILSGTSAGGINGIVLAKALANQQSIDRLRKLWVEEGDIGELLNDKRSYDDLDVKPQRPPRSLLNGYRLYAKALAALRGMKGTEQRWETTVSPSYAEQLDLVVTTTDLQGLRIPIKLYDGVIQEARHKNVFRFAYWTKEAVGQNRNDFEEKNDPMLAFAARCTSSFPFAFEPMVLDDIGDVLPEYAPEEQPWSEFFGDYVRMRAKYRRYAFADGGYLDNKPFSYATEQLARRRADVPVERKLIYIEPDPADALPPEVGAAPPHDRPEVFENVAAAVTKLPRAESIREDIDAVVRRSRTVSRAREVAEEVTDHAVSAVLHGGAKPTLLGNPAESKAYRTLRRQVVLDDIGEVVARVGGVTGDSDAQYALQLVVAAWAQSLADDDLFRDYDLGFRLRRLNFLQHRMNDLLRGRGAAAELATELDLWTIDEATASRLLQVKMALNEIFVELRWRGRGAKQPERTANELGTDTIRANPATAAEDAERFRAVAAAVRASGLTVRELVGRVLDPGEGLVRSEDDAKARAAALADEKRGELQAVADALKGVFAFPLRAAEAAASRVLTGEPAADHDADAEAIRWLRREGEPESAAPELLTGLEEVPQRLRELLRWYYEAFEDIDALLMPLTYPDLGEVNPVDVIRISPQDATSLIDEAKEGPSGRRKLAGTGVHHFAGFLDRRFRVNDIFWGRLDGAERIIETALSPEHPKKDLFVEAAQLAIIDEDLLGAEREAWVTDALANAAISASVTGTSLDELEGILGEDWSETRLREALAVRAYLKSTFSVEREPDRRQMLDVVGRAMSISSDVVGAAADTNKAIGTPLFWVARVGRMITGLAALATPPSLGYLPRLIFRNVAAIAVLTGILLIVLGILGLGGAQRAGWVVILITAVAQAAVWAATSWVGAPDRKPGSRRGRFGRWLVRAAITLVVVALVALVLVGAAEMIDRVSD